MARRLITPHRRADVTADTLALWRCDEASGDLVDAGAGGYDVPDTNAPGAAGSLFATPAGSTGARTLDGATQNFQLAAAPAALRTGLLGEWTITGVLKMDVVQVGILLSVNSTTSGGGSADNSLCQFLVESGGELRLDWKHDAEVVESNTTTGLGLVADRRYLPYARKRLNANDATYDVTLGYWDLETGEGASETFEGLTNADGGGNCGLFIGTLIDGAIDDLRVEGAALTDEAIRRLALDYAADYDEQDLYDLGEFTTALRVKVEDGDGAMRDLRRMARDRSFILGARWGEDIDSAGVVAHIELARDHYLFSLARDMEESPFNLRDSDGLYDPVIDYDRRLLIETAVVPKGREVREIDFVLEFEGAVDDFDWAQPVMPVTARDKIGELQDTQIESTGVAITSIDDTGAGGTLEVETEDVHGLEPGMEVRHDQTENYNGRFTVAAVPTTTTYRTLEGVSGSPDAETQGFAYPPDLRPYGTALGENAATTVQNIIDDNEPSGGYQFDHTVYTPAAIDHEVRTYNQLCEPVLSALDVIATSTGRVLRYRWDDNRYDFRLTYFQPDRSKTTPDWTEDGYLSVDSVAISNRDIRMAVEVRWTDENGERQVLKKEASSHGGRRRRAALISFESTGRINRRVEAEAFADAFLADLSQPKALLEVVCPYRRHVQLGDLGRFAPNGVHWSSNKDLAVTGWEKAFDGASNTITTTMRLRGSPAGARLKLFQMIVYPGLAPNTPTTGPAAPTGVAVSCRTTGLTVSWDDPTEKRGSRQYLRTEVYLSTVNGFEPSEATLQGTTSADHMVIEGLTAGTTYRVVVRHRGRGQTVSPYSAQVSCTTLAEVIPLTTVRTFKAYVGSDQLVTGDADVRLDTEANDASGVWNPATFEFTAPAAGTWLFESTTSLRLNSGTSPTARVLIQKDAGGVGTWTTIKRGNQLSATGESSGFAIATLAAGDKIRARIDVSGVSPNWTLDAGENLSWLSGLNIS